MGREINQPRFVLRPIAISRIHSMQIVDRILGPAIHGWEYRLSTVDRHRRVTGFAWGWEWLRQIPLPPAAGAELDGLDEHTAPAAGIAALRRWNEIALAHSDDYFHYVVRRPEEYELEGDRLRFPSPVASPYPANDWVGARWFEAGGGRAVVVLPQWNADEASHVGLCRLLQRAGIASLRLSLPYHEARKPAELGEGRAEYTVDANIGRTMHAARQAVCDVRAALDWLERQGYARLGIVGTSLGSCYAMLASAHEPRLRTNVFNHISEYFGDVVWTGLATRHVRQGIEPKLDRAALREAWRTISPAAYFDRFAALAAASGKRNLLLYARYDPCFLPEFSRNVLTAFGRLNVQHRRVQLPCGHYTLGQAPFKFAAAAAMVGFLRREL